MECDLHKSPLPWLICGLFFVVPITGSAADDPAPKVHEFKVPKSVIHYCDDQVEAERRGKISKSMSTADVYRLSGEPTSRILKPILKCAAIRKIGGGSASEPSAFAVAVTEDQRKAVEEALSENELFIIYYHYGW